MKHIYIVFSSSPYRIGKLIRRATGEEYNHVSIALDEGLTRMYSFARRYYRTPFLGGFVKESLSRYHVNGKATQIRMCRLEVNDQQYSALEHKLEEMYANREHYLYNHLSAITALFHKAVSLRDAYTCVEFAVPILRDLGVTVAPSKYYTVGDLAKLLSGNVVYTGPIFEAAESDGEYFAKKPVPHPILASLSGFLALFKR